MPAVENMDKRTLGSSMCAGVLGAMLVGLPAYFLMFIDDGEPAVAGKGVLLVGGALVIAGTIVTGLVLVTQKTTRRYGLGLLLGSLATWVLCAAALFVVLAHVAGEYGS